jgi:hypothetical protein
VNSKARSRRIAELAEHYRIAMLRLGATDADFIACGAEPPTVEERARYRDDCGDKTK